MANINRVVLVGNLTRDPELRHTPSGTAICKLRVAVNSRQKDPATGEWGEKPNYFDVTVCGQPGRELRPVPEQGPARRDRRPPRLARVGGQADRAEAPGGRDHRRQRPVPGKPRGGRREPVHPLLRRRCRPERLRQGGRGRGRRRHPLLGERTREPHATGETTPPTGLDRADPEEELLLLPGEDRPGRLQELQPAPPLRVGEGEDPLSPDHRRVPAPPGSDRGGREARARSGAPPLRRLPPREPHVTRG